MTITYPIGLNSIEEIEVSTYQKDANQILHDAKNGLLALDGIVSIRYP